MGLDVECLGKIKNQKLILDYMDDYLSCYDTCFVLWIFFCFIKNATLHYLFIHIIEKLKKEILFNWFCSNGLSILIK